MDHYQLDWELGRLAALSRERMRRRRGIVVAVLIVAAIVLVFSVLGSSDDSNDETGAAAYADLLVLLLFLVALVVGFVQARALRQSLQSVPGVLMGLDKPWRKQVVRDLKTGQPNPDPVLRAVEHIHAERIRRVRTTGIVLRAIYLAYFLYWLVRGVVDESVVAIVPAVMVAWLVTLEIKSAAIYRNLGAFPWRQPVG